MSRCRLRGCLIFVALSAIAACDCPLGSGTRGRVAMSAELRLSLVALPPAWRDAVDRSALLEELRQRLSASRLILLTEESERVPYRCEFVAGLVQSEPTASPNLIGSASCRSRDPNSPPLVVERQLALSRDEVLRTTVGAKIVRRGLIATTDTLIQQIRLLVSPPSEVIAALGAKDRRLVLAAMAIAASRRLEASVPLMSKLLRNEDSEIADRAIGVLVDIGDRRAVRPLTRLAEFSDTEKLAKVIDAVAALGGNEAREYLEFVAVGHPDADIRDIAAQALKRRSARR